jgi:hypothetical protein
MFSTILSLYIIGVIISAVGIFAYEYFYLYDKEIGYMPTNEIIEDILLSFLSWVMVVWLLISACLDCYMGWPSKGYDLKRNKKSQS